MLYRSYCIEVRMAVRLNITMDEPLYRRLKKALRGKGMSAFIADAVRSRLPLDRKALDEAYGSASRELWRSRLSKDWLVTEGGRWPE